MTRYSGRPNLVNNFLNLLTTHSAPADVGGNTSNSSNLNNLDKFIIDISSFNLNSINIFIMDVFKLTMVYKIIFI